MKNFLRNSNKKKRQEMIKAEAVAKSAAASLNFLENEIYKNADVIMLYMPLGNETDTTDIMKRAYPDGKKVVLPVTNPDTGEITPCAISEETEFKTGAFSVSEPCRAEKADTSEIDVVIVPGIVFDKKGNRIGFGKGCYDRFLKNCRAVKMGFCYEFQLCDDIPADEHDIKMDFIVTENGVYKCGKGG